MDARRACDSLLRARTSANWYGREGGIKKKNNIRERKEAGIAITLVLSGPQAYDTRDARLSSGWTRFIILRFVLFRTYEVVSAYRFTKTPAAKSATDRKKNERE